jgi:cell division protein FtsB
VKFLARKRGKALVAQLQSQVEELTKDKAELKRSNDLMRTQLDQLEQQNRTLLMNQLSSQSSQINASNLLSGNNLNSPNNFLGNGLMGSGGGNYNNALLSLAGAGSHVGSGANGVHSSAAAFLGANGGNMNSSLGSMSLLDRLRLQQQLQLQQQQQLGQMSSASGTSNRHSMNQDLLNGMPNNNNNNFLG